MQQDAPEATASTFAAGAQHFPAASASATVPQHVDAVVWATFDSGAGPQQAAPAGGDAVCSAARPVAWVGDSTMIRSFPLVFTTSPRQADPVGDFGPNSLPAFLSPACAATDLATLLAELDLRAFHSTAAHSTKHLGSCCLDIHRISDEPSLPR